ncbi:MAG TPA: chemotaxis protein CheA [Candidatus Acidoferrales bacterium]|nr:chemotaxis protein CheA [Candidatus Acidoferrales bacterium]
MNFFPEERSAELRELFFESAQELLQQLNEAGLELEIRPGDPEIIRSVRRIVHTLKGDSAACGYQQLSMLAHEMEDALAPQATPNAQGSLVEVIFTAADTFQAILGAYRKGLEPPAGDALREHIRQIANAQPSQQNSAPAPLEAFVPHFDWTENQREQIEDALSRAETVYNVALQIDPANGMRSAAFQMIRKVLAASGTVLAIHPSDAVAAEHATYIEAAIASELSNDELKKKCQVPAVVTAVFVEQVSEAREPSQDLLGAKASAKHESHSVPDSQPARDDTPTSGARPSATLASAANTLRVEASRIDTVLNLIGELIIGKSMLHRTFLEFDKRHAKDPLRNRLADALAFQSRVLENLQRSVMKIRMVPVEQLFRRFPRLVRDVAKNCGRDVALEILGENTDLDKSILDALAEPLAHLVRNAVDHGIEPPQERESAGKPRRGTVKLNAYHQGNQVVIEVSDDGQGIAQQKLVRRAIEQGAISADEAEKLTEAAATQLIFHPGLSTADKVTQVSGRGVGMDAVAGALERLKGTVEIQSELRVGTTFRLMVPLTLASIQALLFQVAGRLYAVPLANVSEITRVENANIHRIDDYDVIRLRDQLLTLVHLGQTTPQLADPVAQKSFVIAIGTANRKFGIVVDGLLGEEELVIKALDERLTSSDMVSGASILGDGTVVLVLNVTALAQSVSHIPALGAIA